MVDPQRGVTIVAVPCSAHPMRWRSNLAHELGHLVFNDHQTGEPGAPSVDFQAEQRAQSFARHLLIPIEGIEHFLGRPAERVVDSTTNPIILSTLSDLVQRFQVSPAVAAIQLRGMGVIDQATCSDWSARHTPALAARFGWTDQYTALQAESHQHRAPQRLLARAVAGYIAGLASLETVASIRGITPEGLAAEFTAAGIKPAPEAAQPDGDDLFAGTGEPVDLSWLDDE
jgi:Zn-dependent peptidase ImmA (M78 family)